jgi:acetylornithine deacetylase/succinyl-diaminopimelate desuccinylase-like protein
VIDSVIESDLEARFEVAVEELKAFCRIPSVSADLAYREGIAAAGTWVAERLARAGFGSVEVVPTAGHPLIFAQWGQAPGAPTVLVYGHYDVQPPNPLVRWTTPPSIRWCVSGAILA